MAITLRPINKENWETAARLEVREDQAGFITPNVWSIAEAQFHPWIRPVAVYDGDSVVGFLVYGNDPSDGTCWLYRFMIDRRHQGKGLGKAALRALIDHLRSRGESDAISVGFQPENVVAERLYLGAGFEPGPMAPWGEKTARLVLRGRALPEGQ